MHSKTLICIKLLISSTAFINCDLLVAQDSAPALNTTAEDLIYRDYAERLLRLEETRNLQFTILLLVSLAVISFLLYRVYTYRKLLYGAESKAKVRDIRPAAGHKSNYVVQAVVDEDLDSLPEEEEETVTSPCSDQKILELAQRFEQLMKEEHLYRESFLTRDRVASLLETNRTYIGQVMSEVFHESFSQYVNNLRINEAIAILDNPASKRPIRLIGRDLGFNSVTTFNAQFQKRTGLTPAQYRQNVIEAQ